MKLIWIIGHSNTGKTKLATAIRKEYPHTIIMDDSFRKAMKYAWKTSHGDKQLAYMGKHFLGEGFNVVIVSGSPYEKGRSLAREVLKDTEHTWIHLKNEKKQNVKKAKKYSDYEVPDYAIKFDFDVGMTMKEEMNFVKKEIFHEDD